MPGATWNCTVCGVAALVCGAAMHAAPPPAHTDEPPPAPADRWLQRTAQRFEELGGVEARTRFEAILAEIESLEHHPWAGHYRAIHLSGREVWVAPEGGIFHAHFSDQGNTHYTVAYGQVRIDEDGMMHIDWEFASALRLVEREAPYALVRWGSQRLLISESQFVTFCNSVNGGYGPASSVFLMRFKDGQREGAPEPVTGLPEAPPALRACFLDEPVAAIVTDRQVERLARDSWKVTASLSRGTEHGIFKGMHLYTPGPRDTLIRLEVTDVSAKESTAIYTADWRVRFHQIDAGTEVSSRHPRR